MRWERRVFARFAQGNHAVFPHCWVVLSLKDCVKHFGNNVYRFPGKISQGPIRHAIGTWSLAYLELSDVFAYFGRACQQRSADRCKNKRLHGLFDSLKVTYLQRRNRYRFELGLKIVCQGFGLFGILAGQITWNLQWRVGICDPHVPCCHLPQGLVRRVNRFECIRPLSVPPLLDLKNNPHLQAIYSVVGSGVPVNLVVSP